MNESIVLHHGNISITVFTSGSFPYATNVSEKERKGYYL